MELQLQKLGNQTADTTYPSLNHYSPPPKVSKGEKHEGLPFVVLDYPRIFTKDDIFALRTMVWWGHHYSVSLILKGKYLNDMLGVLKINIDKFSIKNLFISTQGDIWDNKTTKKLEDVNTLYNLDFIKLSYKFSLSQLNNLEYNYFNSIKKLLSLINHTND